LHNGKLFNVFFFAIRGNNRRGKGGVAAENDKKIVGNENHGLFKY
jgi:hypothetical protein